MTEQQKWHLVANANREFNAGTMKLKDGALQVLSARFNTSPKSVKRIMTIYRKGGYEASMAVHKVGNCGRHCTLTDTIRENIKQLNGSTEGDLTIREFAAAYELEFHQEMAKSTMARWLKLMGESYVSFYINPLLSEEHRLNRLLFIQAKFKHAGNGVYKFDDQLNRVHVDEKWFYVDRVERKKRILPGEPMPPPNLTRHKSHIDKIMFLSAISAPRFLPDGSFFDGKIGLFPFVEMKPAQRSSTNRPAGTMEIHAQSVTAVTYANMMTKRNGVLDKIREKMAFLKDSEIFVQHDGAPGHTGHGTEDLLNVDGATQGYDIKFERQPAQSPDLNKNDLCFFASLQSRAEKLKGGSKSKESLLKAVQDAYDAYDGLTLERVHALQFEVYRNVIKNKGGNQNRSPHSNIRLRQSLGLEVVDLYLSSEMAHECYDAISELRG